LFSRICYHADNPLGIGEVGTLKQQLVLRITEFFLSEVQSSIESVQIFIGLLNFQMSFNSIELRKSLLICNEVFFEILALHPLLQVLLTVQGARLDKAVSVVRAGQQGDVCREGVAIFTHDHLANLEIRRLDLLQLPTLYDLNLSCVLCYK
jgi:hypothetical protein